MTVSEKKQYVSYIKLKDELDGYMQDGTQLLLNGKKSDAGEIASECVFNEGSDYMRDYITDESGQLVELNFNCVKSK